MDDFCDKMTAVNWKKVPVMVVYDLDNSLVFIKGNKGYLERIKLATIGDRILSVVVALTIPSLQQDDELEGQ